MTVRDAERAAERRRCLGQGLAMAAAATLPTWASTGALAANAANADMAGQTLRVGTYKGNWRALMRAAGVDQAPYKIEWRELNNGVLHVEALVADALDFGFGSEVPAVLAVRQKANVRLVAVVIEDLNNLITVARRDTPIRSIADLKGKRVGYVRAAITQCFLAQHLASAGLSFADIQPVALSPADGLTAFERGDIDAWAIFGYNGLVARSRFGGRVLKTAVGTMSGHFPIFANPRMLADAPRQAAAADFLLRLRHAYRWANQNFLAFARVQSDETKVPVGDLVEMWNGRSTDFDLRPVDDRVVQAHQQMADLMQRIGMVDQAVTVAPYWDRRFGPALAAPAPRFAAPTAG